MKGDKPRYISVWLLYMSVKHIDSCYDSSEVIFVKAIQQFIWVEGQSCREIAWPSTSPMLALVLGSTVV